MFKKIKNLIVVNFRLLIAIALIFFLILGVSQYYFFYKNNQILKSSIEFNSLTLNNSESEINKTIKNLSKNDDFYSILAKLKILRKNFKTSDYFSLAKEVNDLITNEDLNDVYKAAIATYASYEFINILTNSKNIKDKNLDNKKFLIKSINNFLTFISADLNSYRGFKLEIRYLTSIIEKDNNIDNLSENKTDNLLNEIINDSDISSAIKQRVIKINDFHQYK